MEGVTSVFHLAGNAQLWSRDNSVFDKVNHQGTQIVADAALRAGVERFVYCSSLTTLVSRHAPIGRSSVDETLFLPPEELLGGYPRSKRRGELAVDRAVSEGLRAVTVLPTEPLGAGDHSLTPPTQMILDFVNGATPAYIDCMLNFVPVSSLVEGMILARDRGRVGQRYLLGGENISMMRLLQLIESLALTKTPNTKLPYWVALAAGAVDTGIVAPITGKPPKAPLTGVRLAGRRVFFSSLKAEKELGWRASPAQAALRETIEWFRETGLARQRAG